MKNVLITGADGFIGSHLAEELVKSGYNVRALCQYNSISSWGWLDRSQYRYDMEIILGDIRDTKLMKEIARGIDTLFHLAALIAIPYSYRAPASYVDTNIQGTLNVLQAALDEGVSRFIHTSTSEVYGTARYVPIDENHPLQAQSPYSATKIAADALAFSYYSSFNLPVITARPFNTYGPRQSSRAVIPTVITQLLTGKDRIKLGNMSPTRDFNYVLDTCAGLIKLSENDTLLGEAVNIGSGREISIEGVVKLIGDLMQKEVIVECEEQRLRPINSEVERLLCDNTMIKKHVGFSPRYSLEEGLVATINWLREPSNLERYKADIYNV